MRKCKGFCIFKDKSLAFMISYTPQNQLSLDLFEHPFEAALDPKNRWVTLASLIPWDNLASIYCKHLNKNAGRKSVDVRIVIAAIIVKHMLNLDDRGVILAIQENIYLQYFCGLKSFSTKPVFDASLFVDIRERLGHEEFDAFNRLIINKSEDLKDGRSRIRREPQQDVDKVGQDDKTDDGSDTNNKPTNKGTLKVDATIADQEITYPNDVKVLNECRENLERMIDELYNKSTDGTKPRTYRRIARRDFMNFIKKKRKTKKEVRVGVRKQLQYVNRDIEHLNKLLDNDTLPRNLTKRDSKLLMVINEVYKQQKEMFDNKKHSCKHRIVNIYQPHVRPMPRGKEKAKTEFGSKIDVSLVGGFARIDRLDWETFNESTDLRLQLKNYYEIYHCYPLKYLGDRIYLTRENRKILDEYGIKYYGATLGRPSKNKKENAAKRYKNRKNAAQRNPVEGIFGQGKRGYDLNDIKARRKDTSESMVFAIVFVMNLVALLKLAGKVPLIFVSICKRVTFERVLLFLLGKSYWSWNRTAYNQIVLS